MSSFHGEYDDADSDDSLFPAYTNYINGVDTPDCEPLVCGQDPLPYPDAGPVPYTNSMPSRSMLYRSARDAPPLHYSPIEPTFGGFTDFDMQDSPPVLDLRLPSLYPDLSTLIPPETLQLAPPALPVHVLAHSAAASVKHEQPMSLAEITRRKLLGASLQHSGNIAPPVRLSSQQLQRTLGEQIDLDGSLEKRRMTARQATHPSLLRSSSATDVDSQAGNMPPSRRPMLTQANSPTPVCPKVYSPPQQPQQKPPGCTPNYVPLSSQHAIHQFPSTPLIRPGDLLDNARYATAPESSLKRMHAQINGLYNIAQNHPDPESRNQALMQIAASSAQVHGMVHDREQKLRRLQLEQEAQRQAQIQAQNSYACSTETESDFAQPQGFPNGYEHPVPSPRHQPHVLAQQYTQHMSHQAPFQQLSYQHSPSKPESLLPQTPLSISADLRGMIDAQVPKYVIANQLIATPRTDAKGVADRNAALNWKNMFKSSLPPTGRQYLEFAVAKVSARQNATTHQRITHHQPVQAPQPQPQSQQHYPQQNKSAQPPRAQVPVVPIAEPLRLHINAQLPRFFGAIRVSSMPATAENAELQRQARNFQEQFTATLPPEGHAYIEEIVRRMSTEISEGQEIMTVMQE